MKKYLFFFTIFLAAHAIAQDENLIHTIKPGKEKISATAMLVAGLEASQVPAINTTTKDSSGTALYIAAYVNYQHKSNFGLSVKTYAVPGGSNPGFYLTEITPYYTNYKGKVVPYIAYTRYISHNNPSIPYSPIQNDVYAHLRVKTTIIDPVIGADFAFGNDKENNNESVNDFNAFAAVSHTFSWESLGDNNNQAIGIIPTLQLNAGTDRYFKFIPAGKYISQNRSPKQIGYGHGRGGNNNNGVNEQTALLNVENTFTLSNAEINLYVMYFIGKFSIEPSGSLFIPLRRNDNNVFGYWQINLSYWIR